MTTVVIHDNKVYADGQSTAGRITSYDVKKITNVGNAIIVGCGRWSHCLKFRDFIIDTLDASHAQEVFPHVDIGMPDKMVDDDFMGAVLYPDGTVMLFEGCDDYYEVKQPVFMGSGGDYAAGAVMQGATGIEAINIAIKCDPFTGGEIQVEGFDEEPEPFTREQLATMSKDDILNTLFGKDNLFVDKEDDVDTYYDIDEDKILNTKDPLYLFSIADQLDIKYAHNIGIEKLRLKIITWLAN